MNLNKLSLINLEKWQIAVCVSLALIPVLLLFGVSAGTSIHIFATRHRIEAASGIALCWAMLFTQVKNRSARLIICLLLVAASTYQGFASNGKHLYSWKDAIEAVKKNASVDNAPVLICSDFPESDYVTMPLDAPKKPLLHATLLLQTQRARRAAAARTQSEAMRVASNFYQFTVINHQRFLAMGYIPSYQTLDWLAGSASAQYSVRVLGNYEGVLVLELRSARATGCVVTPKSASTHSAAFASNYFGLRVSAETAKVFPRVIARGRTLCKSWLHFY